MNPSQSVSIDANTLAEIKNNKQKAFFPTLETSPLTVFSIQDSVTLKVGEYVTYELPNAGAYDYFSDNPNISSIEPWGNTVSFYGYKVGSASIRVKYAGVLK